MTTVQTPNTLPASAGITTGKLQECILLIEDNEEAMFLVKDALDQHGKGRYKLQWANCLTDGVAQLSKGGIDLLLLDLGLPESSGPATYAAIREVGSQVPVLVLTADMAEETEVKVTTAGGDDYLLKDQISGPLLLQAIQSTLYASKLRARTS